MTMASPQSYLQSRSFSNYVVSSQRRIADGVCASYAGSAILAAESEITAVALDDQSGCVTATPRALDPGWHDPSRRGQLPRVVGGLTELQQCLIGCGGVAHGGIGQYELPHLLAVARAIGTHRVAGVKRFLAVGGAGSLEVAPGRMLKDTPDFPAAWKPEAEAGARFLDVLKREQALDWAFLSPSAEFAPGERTGKFRLGDDRLLMDATGKSHISMEDFVHLAPATIAFFAIPDAGNPSCR